MYGWTSELMIFAVQFIVACLVFGVLVYVGKFAFRKIKSSDYFKSSRFFNPNEYIPEEEFTSIKQVFYLSMILIFVICILYLLFNWRDTSRGLLIIDVVVSLYLAIHVDTSSFKNKCLLFLLIPFGSMSWVLFSYSYFIFLLDFLHIIAYLYFIKQYYRKFVEYTETNSLGITIILLFFIIFISFFFTMVVEGTTPLDSIEMVSNAFTSNGYAVLGSSNVGKLNAIFLVWAGFLLSGVGTATLTVSIVMRYVNDDFDRLENLVRKKK
ncbi:hypothetical protein [uncultured Methanobrevibacter sp.]|uniref:hypothetical protein n=1 Tax=uncultured Methanobrevibacter sp. TaxID=253161 RepID=UPI00262DB22E|nr:hypothetical protein [uncultured Methanobrevibacter sp.]